MKNTSLCTLCVFIQQHAPNLSTVSLSARNPYTDSTFLCGAVPSGLVLLLWYEPLQKFMQLKVCKGILKIISCFMCFWYRACCKGFIVNISSGNVCVLKGPCVYCDQKEQDQQDVKRLQCYVKHIYVLCCRGIYWNDMLTSLPRSVLSRQQPQVQPSKDDAWSDDEVSSVWLFFSLCKH